MVSKTVALALTITEGIQAVPRPTGNSPADATTFHPGHRLISINNLPDIFYVLYPPREWHNFKDSPKPAQKVDLQGNLMFEQYAEPGTSPQPLLDYRVLPDKVGESLHIAAYMFDNF